MINKQQSKPNSYMGKAYHIDLFEQQSWTEDIPQQVYDLLLGGKGLGMYFLGKVAPRTNPLSPQNDFIIVTGPLTGTLAPCSNKFGVVTKSPATGAFLDAYSSGKLASEIKYAGFDGIIIHGKAPKPSILIVYNDELQVLPAESLGILGKSPLETEQILKKSFGEKYACLSIGLAGELMSSVAGVFTEQRCAARGGPGAVMGSKNIKAILIAGNHIIPVSNPDQFKKDAWIARRYIRSGEISVRALPEEGTANIIDIVNEKFGFPTKNFQTGQFEGANKINGESFRTTYWTKKDKQAPFGGTIACASCPISCSKISYAINTEEKNAPAFPEALEILKKKIVIDGPEYETIFALGSNIGNDDKDTLIYASYLCDFYGIDTISVGVIIGYAMELFEKGIIKEKDLDGIMPIWGDRTVILDLIRKIGKMEGCGQILSKGVRSMAEKWPAGKDFAMHVKGLELPGYEPRSARGMALCYATSDRGACHLHAYTASYELQGVGGGLDPFDLGIKKLEALINAQADSCLSDTAILCFFTFYGLQAKEILNMLSSATGLPHMKVKNYLHNLTKRILAMTRLYNYQEGLTAEQDKIPQRLLSEAQTTNPKRGPITDFNKALSDYYYTMGWDETGKPTMETIKILKIDELIPNIVSNVYKSTK